MEFFQSWLIVEESVWRTHSLKSDRGEWTQTRAEDDSHYWNIKYLGWTKTESDSFQTGCMPLHLPFTCLIHKQYRHRLHETSQGGNCVVFRYFVVPEVISCLVKMFHTECLDAWLSKKKDIFPIQG